MAYKAIPKSQDRLSLSLSPGKASTYLYIYPSAYLSTNQPANQPTSQPANQPTNQPTSQPTNQPTHPSIYLSISLSRSARERRYLENSVSHVRNMAFWDDMRRAHARIGWW
jgi:hypothetical protein